MLPGLLRSECCLGQVEPGGLKKVLVRFCCTLGLNEEDREVGSVSCQYF